MIINVSADELEISISELKGGVHSGWLNLSEIEKEIGKDKDAISSMYNRIEENKKKYGSRLEKLVNCSNNVCIHLNKVKEKKKLLLEKKDRNLEAIERLIKPHTVSEWTYGANGNKICTVKMVDPDANLREKLLREQQEVNQEIEYADSLIKSFSEYEDILRTDMGECSSYLNSVKYADDDYNCAMKNATAISETAKSAFSELCDVAERLVVSIENIRTCFMAFNDYRYDIYRGYAPEIRIPSPAGMRPMTGARLYANQQKRKEPEKEIEFKLKKMNLVSAEKRIVEIAGVYKDEQELIIDLKQLPKGFTVRVKKPIVETLPFFGNKISALSDFMEGVGYRPKMTAIGSRYTDMENRIYFLS